MKKICFITTTSVTLKMFVLDLAHHLHDHGDYDITFIFDTDEEFAESLPEYINFIFVPMKRGFSISGIKAIIQLKKIFKNMHFSLVQYATPNASLYASIAARLANIPVRLYCQWGIRYVGENGFARKVLKIFEKVACFLATDIRAVSFKNMEFSIHEGLYNQDKAYVLGTGGTIGVDLKHYDIENRQYYNVDIRCRYGINNEFVYGFVGRLSKDKGANELIQAFKNISNDENVILFLIGAPEVDPGVDDTLFSWAKETNNVIFTGQVENSRLKEYYSAIDCYVHPSYREGFGMVIQEAAAMGCPIITTNIPGASEVMEKDVSCLLVEAKNTHMLEERMRFILSDSRIRKELSKNARIRVETFFDRNIMLEIQRKDYEVLLSEGK